jgi:hypothetical protein
MKRRSWKIAGGGEGDSFFWVAVRRDPVGKRVRVLSGDE